MIPLRDSVLSRSLPVVTWVLIALNVGVFFHELALGPGLDEFLRTWGFIPARYFHLAATDPGHWVGRALPLVTSMFLHGGWAHLLGNMLYLWIFGDSVEDRLGHGRYLIFYLLVGLAAGLAQAYLYPESSVPTIGASGAISGVLGAYLVLFPTARVLTLVPLLFYFPVVEVPAALYLGFWFLTQLLNGLLDLGLGGGGGGVAVWAHVGGFVVGMALVPLLRRRDYPRVWRDQYAAW